MQSATWQAAQPNLIVQKRISIHVLWTCSLPVTLHAASSSAGGHNSHSLGISLLTIKCIDLHHTPATVALFQPEESHHISSLCFQKSFCAFNQPCHSCPYLIQLGCIILEMTQTIGKGGQNCTQYSRHGCTTVLWGPLWSLLLFSITSLIILTIWFGVWGFFYHYREAGFVRMSFITLRHHFWRETGSSNQYIDFHLPFCCPVAQTHSLSAFFQLGLSLTTLEN